MVPCQGSAVQLCFEMNFLCANLCHNPKSVKYTITSGLPLTKYLHLKMGFIFPCPYFNISLKWIFGSEVGYLCVTIIKTRIKCL